MKIGLNATCISSRPSGARQRFLGIYPALVRQLPDSQFIVYESSDCRLSASFPNVTNVDFVRTPLHSSSRFTKAIVGFGYWQRVLRRHRFDIFEMFHLPAVSGLRAHSLLTIHDIGPIREDSGALNRWIYWNALKNSVNAVERIIVVSNAVKAELQELFPEKNIEVLYNGITPDLFSAGREFSTPVANVSVGLLEGFVLAVGHFRDRKNYVRLVEAWALLRSRGIVRKLVIAGNDSGSLANILARIEALNLSDSVVVLSNLSDDEIRNLYLSCSLFVFPSTYEGFGIPILEAMKARKPMALSDIPVFREITENQSAYFNPMEPESMATVIQFVLADPAEQQRQVRYGLERQACFHFENLATKLAGIYHEMLGYKAA